MTFKIFVYHNEEGWGARDDFYRIEAERADSQEDAINFVVGSVYAALAYREHPPREVKFEICDND